jgi:hypothetical protein
MTKLARAFTQGKYFKDVLVFMSDLKVTSEPTRVEHLYCHYSMCGLLVLTFHEKCLPGINTLAYFLSALVAKERRFIFDT